VVARFAEAVNDRSPGHLSGLTVPPTYIVVPTWEAMSASVSGSVRGDGVLGGVHGEQDIVVHRPLRAGEMVRRTMATVRRVKVGSTGTRLTLRISTVDGDDHLMNSTGPPCFEAWCPASQEELIRLTTDFPTGQGPPRRTAGRGGEPRSVVALCEGLR